MSGISNHDRAHMADILADRHGDWFTAHLLRLIKKADFSNRARFRTVFPEEVAAVEEYEINGECLPVVQGTPID